MTATLRELQRALERDLLQGDMRAARYVVSTPKLRAQDRLAIYQNAYRARLAEALAGDYPVLSAVLGETAFRELCARYITAYPSGSFTLRNYGARLPQFIADDASLADSGAAAELARLEWVFVDTFDAPDAPAADVSALAAVEPAAWPGIEIDPHPSVRMLPLRFNALAVRQAVVERASVPPFANAEASRACFVWRRELTTMFRQIDRMERDAWLALYRGEAFAAMCDVLARDCDLESVPLRAATYFRTWLEDGLIARVHH